MRLRACLETTRGAVFGEKAGWRGATKENIPGGSSTEEQRSQTAFSPKTLRAAGLLSVAGVGSVVTARCGDASTSPPWPQPKSLAAAPLVVSKQALSLSGRKAGSRVGLICLAGLLALAGDAKSADPRVPNAAQPSAVTVDLKKASHPPTSVEKQIEKLDPSVDGWDTEAFNDAVAVPLRALTGVIEHPRKVDASALRPFLTGDFGCQALRPEKLKPVYDDGAFRVARAEDAVEKSLQPSVTDHAGAEGLLAALKELTDALVDMEALHCKFKQFQVEKSGALLVTRILYEASGHNAKGSIQQNATWRCQWVQSQAGGAPRLKWIGLERYEEVNLKCPGGQWFVDCTASALGGKIG